MHTSDRERYNVRLTFSREQSPIRQLHSSATFLPQLFGTLPQLYSSETILQKLFWDLQELFCDLQEANFRKYSSELLQCCNQFA